jgi:hypothetical protein
VPHYLQGHACDLAKCPLPVVADMTARYAAERRPVGAAGHGWAGSVVWGAAAMR